jgi:uncharacterized membrane protein
MSVSSWSFSDDLSGAAVIVVAVVLGLALLLLALELRQRERYGGWIVVSGALALLMLGAAILRPVRVTTRGSLLGPRVVVLVDQSRRLLLPAGNTTRRDRALDAVERVGKHFSEARLAVFGFGEGKLEPLAVAGKSPQTGRLVTGSDLLTGIGTLPEVFAERPEAVVVISDGRLARPSPDADTAAVREALRGLGVPVHTLRVLKDAPRDASIRAVRATGAAVAHQPLTLSVDIGCAGGLECRDVPVTVRELRSGVEPALLASGVAKIQNGSATVELSITLERAGARIVEIAIEAPSGDSIPENDTRTLAFVVTRDRVRLLHVAGRPTYDVRALRMWLKADQSVDVVAFFILRSNSDDPGADESELALIPFPVDELFTEHLSSFDAVVLQDINAVEYRFAQYLPALASYVNSGGGVIMVGGPSSFVGGGYAESELATVLPVQLPPEERAFDVNEFVPRYTDAGREAAVLRSLRELSTEELPAMSGSNTLGPARDGAIVLWEHPERKAGAGPMPMLALGEAGDGRSIALGVDGTHALAFSEIAAKVAGRAYGALWDGLLGWLMRDPRYEAARIETIGECIVGEPLTLRLTRMPGQPADVELTLEKLGTRSGELQRFTAKAPAQGPVEIAVGKLAAGGYTARARIGNGPPTRQDFACERGGEAWSDSRPDPERLERISEATGGLALDWTQASELPLPEAKRVATERHVRPVLPPWVWTLLASVLLGSHWLLRRRGGLI